MKTRLFFISFMALLSSVFSFGQDVRLVGGDISLLPSYEAVNTPYRDKNNQTISDLVTYVKETCGWNACRVRLFVNPVIVNKDGTKQGEVQDLPYVLALGKRIKDAGMAFMLDFHYSDTWADPVKQTIPTAWKSLTEEQLLDTVYHYTRNCLDTLVAAGATPDYVQIGNEVSYGMLWRNNDDKVWANSAYENNATAWQRFNAFLNAGARAVREVTPQAKIIVHIERTTSANTCVNFYNCLAHDNVDYDIIGLSFYPFWHGWITGELKSTLNALEQGFPDKSIQIVETAYYNNYFPVNDSGTKFNTSTVWPGTEAGQDAYLAALISELKNHDNVNGLYYWFPEENGNGGASYNASKIVITNWLNRGLFNPNSHKALSGLYRLKDYVSDGTAVDEVTIKQTEDGIVYSILGLPVGTSLEQLPQGVYILNGKKVKK
ncbi:MAG: glycosyl hydrolase 53 family protein [Paludibacteraceae bacterium]|nr:glycosyl hydrolase 53 family protein [Paludibacteraceae bacterium]